MDSFDFYFRIKRYSISINPKLIQIDKWDGFNFDSYPIFRFDFPQKKQLKPKPKPIETTDDDDDFDPIPF
ncbi:hypothetical protein [Planktothrix mougeotii]|uniref:Uncharacterized protein n=1 Tax=Planktothrix mougeotii LEGE 06226 TaxID=1828728 RepID=A0ABR9UEN2_9CYAN|nr:hypothetical protein [Planktothrix mougeotii]MBE9144917.1 hypothetical protein [Planktothrix mougeotii LEGE 06226]